MSSEARKLLVVVDTLTAGGAERVAVELAAAVDRSLWDPRVLVTRTDGPLADVLNDAKVPYDVLGKTKRYDRRAWRALKTACGSADLVHSHKFGSNVWAAAAARQTGTPTIGHEHNFAAESGQVRKLLDRYWIAPSLAALVCVSESVAATVRRHGVPERKLRVIPNGVRLSGVASRGDARAELGITGEQIVIGIVGRLRPEKAHDVLIAAAALLPPGKAHIVIVGDGPCRGELEQQVKAAGLESSITFAGEHANASRLASAFDIAVISSHWEGLPLAALEAMAAGVPLVATGVGGLVDLLADGAGVLVKAGDPAAMAAGLQQVISMSAESRHALGAAGQARVRDRFAFDDMVAAVSALYEEVLAS